MADAEVSRLRVGTGAWLLASVVPLTVVGALAPAWPGWVTGVIAWTACALFWCDMPPRQRAIVLALVGEHLGRIQREVEGRPLYAIDREL